MKDDELLAKIGAAARHEQADDAALEAIARGDEGSSAAAALTARASEDPTDAALVAAARPLREGVEATIAATITAGRVDRAEAAAAGQSAAAAGSAAGGGKEPPASSRSAGGGKEPPASSRSAPASSRAAVPTAAPSGSSVAKVVPLWRRALVLVGPLALAAAVFVYVAGENDGPALPAYALTAVGEQEVRGDPAPSARLVVGGGPSSRFEIVAQPESSAEDRVAAWVFGIDEGEPTSVEAKVEVSEEGAVRVTGNASVLEGVSEVRIVVAMPGSIAKYDEALAVARKGKGNPRVRVLAVSVERRPQAAP